MTRERAKELLPVIQAFAEGKTVQCKSPSEVNWSDNTSPSWVCSVDYRVKPEPREFWVYVRNNFGACVAVSTTCIDDRGCLPDEQRIRVREVIE